MSSVWAKIKGWFTSANSKVLAVTRAPLAEREYKKVQNERTKRNWWARITRKEYTLAELVALEDFFTSENPAHVAYWEGIKGRKCVTHPEKKECTSWRLERYEAIQVLLQRMREKNEKITVGIFNKTMEDMLKVPQTVKPKVEVKQAA